jgi:hypothetical protein
MKTTKEQQRLATISTPQNHGAFTLHPATFGLIEWLQSARKNPVICGGDVELYHVGEICFAFTRPSAEVTAIPDKQVQSKVREFLNDLAPEPFLSIQNHAEKEIKRFFQTSLVPKKPKAAARQKVKR